MDSISFPVIAPRLDRLKRTGSRLHLLAGALILAHAISHFRGETTHTLYFWCLLIISLDIFLLVLVGRDLLLQMPRVSLLFRVIEIIFFTGIGTLMLAQGSPVTGLFHLLLAIAYGYLCYCERIFGHDETLSIHHTGITIPDIPESHFLYWTHINKIEARYDSIDIITAGDKPLRFQFRNNLNFEELEQVQAFCQFYLGMV
ncbi:MAG TPA: hypothetical protein VGS79_29270 [Puia sp.]|nr:hypothetical protein [Puia sp.]